MIRFVARCIAMTGITYCAWGLPIEKYFALFICIVALEATILINVQTADRA